MKSFTIAYIHGISRVNVFPKYKEWERQIREVTFRSGFLWLKKTTKLCVCSWASDTPVDEWIAERPRYYIEDNELFIKPHVTIIYVDGKWRDEFFETLDELNTYVDQIKAAAPHLQFN